MGPNPRVVDMFLAEKGVEIERIQVDILAGENRRDSYLKVNPSGQSPALMLDSGDVIAEITAVCDYLEELFPEPVLIGNTAEQRAETRMWCRRIDLMITEPMSNGFRWGEGLDLFKSRMFTAPAASDAMKAMARDGLQWLDAKMVGPFIAGQRFSLADIQLFCFLDFVKAVGQPLDASNTNIVQWMQAVSERPSAAASIHASQG